MEASPCDWSWILRNIWAKKAAECARVDLLDTVVCEGGAVQYYMFTSQSGQVMRKNRRFASLARVREEFLRIAVSREIVTHHLIGQLERFVEGHLDLPIKRRLSSGNALGRARRNLSRQILGCLLQFGRGDRPVDEPKAFGSSRVELITRQCHFQCVLSGEIPTDTDQWRGAEGADIDSRRAEGSGLGGNSQIAGRDQLAARGASDPLHAGNDGFGGVQNARHHRGAILQ